MAKKKDKQKPEVKSLLDFRLEMLEAEFKKEADFLAVLMRQGGGIQNIHMLGCLQNLQMTYLQVAAHRDAKRSLQASLDD